MPQRETGISQAQRRRISTSRTKLVPTRQAARAKAEIMAFGQSPTVRAEGSSDANEQRTPDTTKSETLIHSAKTLDTNAASISRRSKHKQGRSD